MEDQKLELIAPRRPRPNRAGSLALAGVLIALALIATLFGADVARRPFDASKLAEQILMEALAEGNEQPDVKRRLVDLRLAIARRPLDSKTRVAYASLLLGLSRQLEDLEVSAFHARRSASLAPVTLPIVRTASMVLAYGGQIDEALALGRSVFEYDSPAAAKLLATMEPQIPDDRLSDGLLDTPDAWLAWSNQLEQTGRKEEAAVWLGATNDRWPDHAPALERRAALAVRGRDWNTLRDLFNSGRRLAEERPYALAWSCRALLHIHDGDERAAVDDIETALRLDPESWSVQIYAGEVYEAIGRHERARDYWSRVLFSLPHHASWDTLRLELLVQLARWEEEHGKAATAYRFWSSLLELDPDHVEARQRAEALSGFSR